MNRLNETSTGISAVHLQGPTFDSPTDASIATGSRDWKVRRLNRGRERDEIIRAMHTKDHRTSGWGLFQYERCDFLNGCGFSHSNVLLETWNTF